MSIDSLSRSARRFLAARLFRLQQTLEAFGQRVRESLAAVIDGHSGDAVRDALHAVLRNGRQLRPTFLDTHPDDRFDLHDVAQDEMPYDEPMEFWRDPETTPLAAPADAKPPSRWRGMLTAGLHKGVDLAGFHLSFGLAVLSAEIARARHPFRLRGRALLDAQTIYRRMESRDLRAAVRRFLGREHTNAHSARVDVRAAIEVLDAQLGLDPDLPRTPAALHAELVEVEVARLVPPRRAGTGRLRHGQTRREKRGSNRPGVPGVPAPAAGRGRTSGRCAHPPPQDSGRSASSATEQDQIGRLRADERSL